MPSPSLARRRSAAGVLVAMLATVGPAVGAAIGRGSTVGLFPPDLGAAVLLSLLGAFLLGRGATVRIAAILCVQGVGASLTVLTGFLRDTAVADGRTLHGATLWAAWVNVWSWLPGVSLLVPLLLLFPDGRLTGWRWRWLIRSTTVVVVLEVLAGLGIRTSLVDDGSARYVRNPTGVLDVSPTVSNLIGSVLFVALVSMIAISLGALVVRRRRARDTERAQVTSLLYGGAMSVVLIAATQALPEDAWWAFVVGALALAPVAASIAMAVLRYRLYEIDRIVSRTVAYVLVLAVLAGLYLGIVLGLSALVPHRYGQIGVVLATLAVSALAVPLTRRVRRTIDRRFNRRRYDAERLVDQFAGRLRAGLDPESTGSALLDVAARAVEPRVATIWIVPTRPA